MSEFIIHSVPGSPFGRSVLTTLEEKGASYRLAPVVPGTLQSPEHLARHPFGRVPVLEHDGFMLYETQAILRYLDRVLPQPRLTPDDPKRAARMDQAMNVNAPRLMGRAPDEAAIEAAMPKAKTVFNELARLLGRASYFAGEEISLADMLLAPAVAFFTRTPEWSVLGAPHHHLVAWLSRMEARPSMQATTWERLTALVAQAA
jgi:glutathione S-transferase